MAADRLTIGEVADLAGVQASTLRYYERIGILPRPARVSGQRRYSREILALLAVIQLAKEANFSLPEIQSLLYSGEGTPSERWRGLVRQKIDDIERVIAEAQERKLLLEEALNSEALHYELDECTPLIRQQRALRNPP